MYLNSWASADKRILLVFHDEVLKVFANNAQTGEAPESGGILLGRVRGENLEVVRASAPSVHDRRLRYFFERLPLIHQSFADRWWSRSSGTVRYLGEWHTHPEDYPTPSSIDRKEWRLAAGRRRDGRPMLATIVGLKALHVELVSASESGAVLLPVE